MKARLFYVIIKGSSYN